MNRDEQPRHRRPLLWVYLLAAFALTMLVGLSDEVLAQSQWTTNGDNISNTNSGNVGIGTNSPPFTLTIKKDYNGPTVVGAFNTADGHSAQIGLGVSRTMDYSSKYFVLGVTAPSYGAPEFGETAYLHSKGVPIKFGSQSANDIYFFTNGISNTRLTIASGGNLGIGTTTPNSKLVIKQSVDSFMGGIHLTRHATADTWSIVTGLDNNLYVGYANNASGADAYTDFTVYPLVLSAFGNVGIGTGNPQAKLDVQGNVSVTGNISATGNIAAKYQDVAEWVPSRQKLAAGTVVVLDPEQSNNVMASTSAYDTKVAGVVSAQPGVILGEAGENKLMVATTGRVKIKVDATRSPIKVGDLLVTGEKEGVAMKSEPLDLGGAPIHRPGTLIGKALEPLEKGTGEILVLLSLQ